MFGIIGDILSNAAKTLVGDHEEPEIEVNWNSAKNDSKKEKSKVNQQIKALEEIEAETDPVIKRRMLIYYDRGIYDFSGIRNI